MFHRRRISCSATCEEIYLNRNVQPNMFNCLASGRMAETDVTDVLVGAQEIEEKKTVRFKTLKDFKDLKVSCLNVVRPLDGFKPLSPTIQSRWSAERPLRRPILVPSTAGERHPCGTLFYLWDRSHPQGPLQSNSPAVMCVVLWSLGLCNHGWSVLTFSKSC